MLTVANLLSDSHWAELALGAGGGFAAAAGWIHLQQRTRELNRIRNDELEAAHERQRQFLLLCEDTKVLTDLAMQRHMNDAQFLQSLRAQPCFKALFPFFSQEFRKLLTEEPSGNSNKAFLAVACRAEIARLESAPEPIGPSPLERFGHRHGLGLGETVTIAIGRHVEPEILPEPHEHEIQKF